MHDKPMNGWKEIATYLGRTVRTAQRWEAQLEMPVHRPASRKRTAVVALRSELNIWLVRNRSQLESQEESANDFAVLSEKLNLLQREATQLALELQRARGSASQFYNPRPSDTAESRESID